MSHLFLSTSSSVNSLNISFVSLLLWYKVIGSLWILAILGDTCSFTTLLYVGKYIKRMHKETHQQRDKGITACKKEQLVHMYSYIFWRFVMTFLTRIFVCSDFTGIIRKIRNRSGPSCGQGPWRPQEILQEGWLQCAQQDTERPCQDKSSLRFAGASVDASSPIHKKNSNNPPEYQIISNQFLWCQIVHVRLVLQWSTYFTVPTTNKVIYS